MLARYKQKIVLLFSVLVIGVFTGCTPSLPYIMEKTTYKEYKKYPKNKALAYGKSNSRGYYVYGTCKNMKSEKDAMECAIKKCKKVIKPFMKIDKSACKIYDLNNKIIWK